MENKFFHLKFPDGSIYKGDFQQSTKDMFSNFGFLNKNNEIYLSFEDALLNDYLCKN